MLKLDHLAISCGALDEGQAMVESALGATLQTGGKHPHFGTQNMLLRLDDGIYLEVIAIDPLATPTKTPRWFDLDRFSGPARLTNWICAADDLTATLAKAPDDTGTPVPLTRGNLAWTMAVPDDGILPFNNAFPALIEWGGDGRNPSHRLMPSNCALKHLVIAHPQADALKRAFAPLINDPRIVVEQADDQQLIAEISTPYGVKIL